MKRVALLLVLPFLLVACSGSEGDGARGDASAACEQRYWDGTVGTCLPANWVVVSQESMDERGLPAEVITAFQSKTAISGQYPTVTVTTENVGQNMTPQAYSFDSIRAVTALPEYAEVSKEDWTIDGEQVELHIFTARPIEREPVGRFYQVSTVSDGVGYTFTGFTRVAAGNGDSQIRVILGNISFTVPDGVDPPPPPPRPQPPAAACVTAVTTCVNNYNLCVTSVEACGNGIMTQPVRDWCTAYAAQPATNPYPSATPTLPDPNLTIQCPPETLQDCKTNYRTCNTQLKTACTTQADKNYVREQITAWCTGR